MAAFGGMLICPCAPVVTVCAPVKAVSRRSLTLRHCSPHPLGSLAVAQTFVGEPSMRVRFGLAPALCGDGHQGVLAMFPAELTLLARLKPRCCDLWRAFANPHERVLRLGNSYLVFGAVEAGFINLLIIGYAGMLLI